RVIRGVPRRISGVNAGVKHVGIMKFPSVAHLDQIGGELSEGDGAGQGRKQNQGTPTEISHMQVVLMNCICSFRNKCGVVWWFSPAFHRPEKLPWVSKLKHRHCCCQGGAKERAAEEHPATSLGLVPKTLVENSCRKLLST